MSEQDPNSAGGAEPSMEDILASIRRILAEDGAPAESEEQLDAVATTEEDIEADIEADVEAGVASEPPASPLSAQAEAVTPVPQQPLPVDDEGSIRPARPRPPPFDDDVFANAFNSRGDEEEMFVLTPDMRIEGSIGGERVVSQRTAATGTDVLAQLASAILDRRDIAVSTREVTLEGMVREMLRPLLREWLDRNLPYLIERLVKREIDLMINRAERLED